MSSNPPSERDGAVSSESFEEWLEQAADSKGVSKQELMNQMLSSYWILDELTGLVGETGGSPEETDHRSPGRSESIDASGSSDADSDEPSTSDSSDDSTEESIKAIQAAIRELAENQSPADQPPAATEESSHPFDGGVVAVVSDLQRQVGRFDSQLEELDDRQNEQFDRLSNELQLLIDRVGGLEREHDQFVTESDLESLSEDVRNLDDRTRELRDANSEIEARLDREFDSIEELFRRVLDAIDEIDSELEATRRTYRDEVEPIKEREADREKLRDLKQEALQHEIRRGSCENCDRSVDLAMLDSPVCPNCAVRFTGIDDSGWNPFRSPTLKTDPLDEA